MIVYQLAKLILINVLFLSVALAATNDSTKVTAVATNPGTILTLENGYVNWPSNDGGSSQTVNTGSKCPVNFTPYVTITPTKVYAGSGWNQSVISFGACVKSLTDTGTVYQITYLTSKSYGYSNETWMEARIYVNGSNGAVVYGSYDPNIYSFDASRRIGYTKATYTGGQVYTDTGGITWTLYCYPSGINPPSNQLTTDTTGCSAGSSPF